MSLLKTLKLEPPVSPSPSADAEGAKGETWLSDVDVFWANNGNILTADFIEPDNNILDLGGLEQIEDLDKWITVDDSYANCWLEGKMLPLFEEPKNDTIFDTQEFETVFDFVHNNGALTPPQSPPPQQLPILATLESIAINFNPATSQNVQNVVQEMQIVDELVRKRAELMVEKSPNSSNFSDSSSDDMEWLPDCADNCKITAKKSQNPRLSDRKVRKKEQNKNAATRYRMKKKAEVDEILGEEKELMDENSNLDQKVTELSREIKYLKGLMRDLIKAKGINK